MVKGFIIRYETLGQYEYLYIHVTVHRNRFISLFFNNQPDALINQIHSGYGRHKPARNLPVPNVQ